MTFQIQAPDFPALWAQHINENNLTDVIDLYNDNFVLMPTFSPHIVNTVEKLNDYFVRLASRDGLVVELHEKTVMCQQTREQSYVITGVYSFKFEIDETLLTFPSRFTFVVDMAQDKPILHHHSSQVPRNLS
ncbi:MAG: hypothetical protein ACJAUP_002210 [Cellvibrionaceae bacterium]|jgi:hypothetical protein